MLCQKRNPAERKAANERYRQRHRAEIAARSSVHNKKYYYADLDNNREKARLYRKTTAMREKQRIWNMSPAGQISRANKKARRRIAIGNSVISTEQWVRVVNAFDGCCAYCGKNGLLSADHFVALASGGKHVIGNLVPACVSCNGSKGAKDPFAWMARKAIDADLVVSQICEAY
jgi:5-methylcytosine-specific restriction endonuclease McrA